MYKENVCQKIHWYPVYTEQQDCARICDQSQQCHSPDKLCPVCTDLDQDQQKLCCVNIYCF